MIKGKGAFWSRVVVPLVVLAGLIVFTATFFALITAPGEVPNFTCTPNGAVKFSWSSSYDEIRKPYSPTWDPSQFLSITLGIGSFTFTQAKAIDFLWDLSVGRGGQFVLTWCCYPIFRRSLLLEMESREITVPTFASLAFDKIGWSSVRSLASPCATEFWTAFRELDKTGAVRSSSPGRLIPFLGAFAYILLFPSWMSIMTGYQAQSQPYVHIANGNLIPTTALEQPDAVVIEGSNSGLSDQRVVFRSKDLSLFSSLDDCELLVIALERWKWLTHGADDSGQVDRSGTLDFYDRVRGVELAQHNSGPILDAHNTITIDNHTYILQQPLNVAISNYEDAQGENTINIYRATEYRSYLDEALSVAYLRYNTTCQPSTNYHWGFSSLLLFAFCVTSVAFASTMFLLDAESFWHGRADVLYMPVNVYRDALDLSIELRARYGERVDQMPSKQLLNLVGRERSQMSLDLTHLPQSRKRMRQQQQYRATRLGVDREVVASFLERAKATRNGSDAVVHEEIGLSDLSLERK
ncbi:hypothetical protein LTR56_012034 [Elasticomyces elasticus]|nr:hypothetical protein LTR22_023659 [Elasticomyces elasticus]KAK3640237.1 hypothetical protein LTR56_012034 [Elasticomyces elasticus]